MRRCKDKLFCPCNGVQRQPIIVNGALCIVSFEFSIAHCEKPARCWIASSLSLLAKTNLLFVIASAAGAIQKRQRGAAPPSLRAQRSNPEHTSRSQRQVIPLFQKTGTLLDGAAVRRCKDKLRCLCNGVQRQPIIVNGALCTVSFEFSILNCKAAWGRWRGKNTSKQRPLPSPREYCSTN